MFISLLFPLFEYFSIFETFRLFIFFIKESKITFSGWKWK